MDINDILKTAVNLGISAARSELVKLGVTVDDDLVDIARDLLTSLWGRGVHHVNAKTMVFTDERKKP